MNAWGWRALLGLLLAAAIVFAPRTAGQRNPGVPAVPLPQKTGPLNKALLLLREGKTAEARQELEGQRKLRPDDAEVLYQIARACLMDFDKEQEAERRRMSLGLAMEMLNGALKRNPDHIPT